MGLWVSLGVGTGVGVRIGVGVGADTGTGVGVGKNVGDRLEDPVLGRGDFGGAGGDGEGGGGASGGGGEPGMDGGRPAGYSGIPGGACAAQGRQQVLQQRLRPVLTARCQILPCASLANAKMLADQLVQATITNQDGIMSSLTTLSHASHMLWKSAFGISSNMHTNSQQPKPDGKSR